MGYIATLDQVHDPTTYAMSKLSSTDGARGKFRMGRLDPKATNGRSVVETKQEGFYDRRVLDLAPGASYAHGPTEQFNWIQGEQTTCDFIIRNPFGSISPILLTEKGETVFVNRSPIVLGYRITFSDYAAKLAGEQYDLTIEELRRDSRVTNRALASYLYQPDREDGLSWVRQVDVMFNNGESLNQWPEITGCNPLVNEKGMAKYSDMKTASEKYFWHHANKIRSDQGLEEIVVEGNSLTEFQNEMGEALDLIKQKEIDAANEADKLSFFPHVLPSFQLGYAISLVISNPGVDSKVRPSGDLNPENAIKLGFPTEFITLNAGAPGASAQRGYSAGKVSTIGGISGPIFGHLPSPGYVATVTRKVILPKNSHLEKLADSIVTFSSMVEPSQLPEYLGVSNREMLRAIDHMAQRFHAQRQLTELHKIPEKQAA